MSANRVGVLCVLLLMVGAVPLRGQAFPARIKLTRITTNSNGLVTSKITEKSIVARCANDNSLNRSRLKLFFIAGDFDVVDTVTSNIAYSVATLGGECPTNVIIAVFSGTESNRAKIASFTPFNSTGEGVLPADFAGTLCATYSASLSSNGVSTMRLKGKLQGGSVTNNAVYIGTVSIGGKPFGLPSH